MKNYDQIKTRLLKEQSSQCWVCKLPLTDGHIHHAIISRDKRFADYLDQPENLIIVCPRCHGDHGKLSNWEMRCRVYSWKIDRGYDVDSWLASLPFRVKDRFVSAPKEER